MKKQLTYLLVIVFAIVPFSCGKDDADILQEPEKSSAKQITSFVFMATENDAITEDITAVINEQNKTISAIVLNGSTITSLKPTLQLSEKAIVDQTGAKDFSSPIDYSVAAEDGTKVVYKTTVTIAPNSAKQLLSFSFKKEDNQLYGDETITATIDEDTKTIMATVSYSANAALLLPSIEISPDATISPEDAQDFKDAVSYTITAEDGSISTYQVLIETSFTDRDALIAIYNANPNNTLPWNLEDPDISNWRGISLDENNNIIGLILIIARIADEGTEGRNLRQIPNEITNLSFLTHLDLGGNLFTDIPPAVLQLKSLTSLMVDENNMTLISNDIGKLENLNRLELYGNKIKRLPPGIGDLKRLTRLSLYDNNLTELPKELGQLSNLERLSLDSNELTSIPPEIGNLNSLTKLTLSYNQLTSIPKEMSSLNSLTTLYLDRNQLISIPKEIGQLTSLTRLNLRTNLLTSIPQDVCNLENTGTFIQLDSIVTCK